MTTQRPWNDPHRPAESVGHDFGRDQQQRVRPSGFPFPGVRGTTRGGTRWQVGGCCLPIPIGCMGLMTVLATIGAVAVPAARRRRQD